MPHGNRSGRSILTSSMPTDAMSSEKSTVAAARWKATGTW
ncbi:hypothetical protein AGRO_4751 [Agrobacterium sp. ATCC 31749]|nr:hypothetical protein AGRO_4751 [Agrobacterium sp. ATCC 31749]